MFFRAPLNPVQPLRTGPQFFFFYSAGILPDFALWSQYKLLRIYREKDAVEKSFSHIKPHIEVFSRSEEGTRARMFLTILGYTLVAIISFKLGISYNQALNTISGMREVVYSSGAHAPVEYTKEQKEILEKLKLKW